MPPEPSNWDDFDKILTARRQSLSPSRFSDGEHKQFKQAEEDALNEAETKANVVPVIAGHIEDSRKIGREIRFTNLEPLIETIDEAERLKLAHLDYY